MAVSFSAGAKAEICKGIPQKNCCALAESFGILLFCNSFSADGIRIITSCRNCCAKHSLWILMCCRNLTAPVS